MQDLTADAVDRAIDRAPDRRAVDQALERALVLAARGPAHGPNPQVGCVLVDTTGTVVGEGWHRGAGTPHAEAAALASADPVRLRGATAVVTLEPCHHSGRTPPCSVALRDAGVARVVYACADPNPVAAGGVTWLARHGVEVRTGAGAGASPHLLDRADRLLEPWAAPWALGRPWVTGKTATSLDGRVAAADGTSRWITGAAARAHAHTVRSAVDAIVAGTGTVLSDDPALTARRADGSHHERQPVRVVVGRRAVPPDAAVRWGPGTWRHAATHDLAAVLDELGREGARRVLLEGGPTLLGAALRAGLVDELHAYLAPVLLGSGTPAVPDLDIATLAHAQRWHTHETHRLGEDVLVVARRPERKC